MPAAGRRGAVDADEDLVASLIQANSGVVVLTVDEGADPLGQLADFKRRICGGWTTGSLP
jgi:hypothetical protein